MFSFLCIFLGTLSFLYGTCIHFSQSSIVSLSTCEEHIWIYIQKHSSISPPEGSKTTVNSKSHFKVFGLKLNAAVQLWILTGCWYKLIIRWFACLINDYIFIVNTDGEEKRQVTYNQGPSDIYFTFLCVMKGGGYVFFF